MANTSAAGIAQQYSDCAVVWMIQSLIFGRDKRFFSSKHPVQLQNMASTIFTKYQVLRSGADH
jgi:hypothetical protein